MITTEILLSIQKDGVQAAAECLETAELPRLVDWLCEKDDAIRYQALLLLIARSQQCGDVYPYWDVFAGKLSSDNSYQRSIGLMLIAHNTKWDSESRLDGTIDAYLALLNDEKPITVRQCIQSLGNIVPYQPHLHRRIAAALTSVDIMSFRETMRKLILTDVLDVLLLIRKQQAIDDVERYIDSALSGPILDAKTKKRIQSMR